MNVWLIATAGLLLCLVPCTIGVLRGGISQRLVALEAAQAVTILALLTLEQGLARPSFFDLSLALTVLALPSTLIFARIYRRWL